MQHKYLNTSAEFKITFFAKISLNCNIIFEKS